MIKQRNEPVIDVTLSYTDIEEREIDQDWFLSDTAWEDYYNDKQIEA